MTDGLSDNQNSHALASRQADSLNPVSASLDMALPEPAENPADARYMCQLGSVTLVFEPSVNIEVLLDTRVNHMPNTPDWLMGLCNRRGELVPVFDLHSLLGHEQEASEKKYLFIVDRDEYAAGFYIDDYPSSVYSITALAELPDMPTLLQPHVVKCYRHQQQTLLELDHRSLFKAITKQLSTDNN